MELWYTFVNNRGTINVKTVHFMSMVRSKSSGNLTSVRKACLCSGKCLAMQCLFFVFATIDLSLCILTGLSTKRLLIIVTNESITVDNCQKDQHRSLIWQRAACLSRQSLATFFYPSVTSSSNLPLHAVCFRSLKLPVRITTLIIP